MHTFGNIFIADRVWKDSMHHHAKIVKFPTVTVESKNYFILLSSTKQKSKFDFSLKLILTIRVLAALFV